MEIQVRLATITLAVSWELLVWGGHLNFYATSYIHIKIFGDLEKQYVLLSSEVTFKKNFILDHCTMLSEFTFLSLLDANEMFQTGF